MWLVYLIRVEMQRDTAATLLTCWPPVPLLRDTVNQISVSGTDNRSLMTI